MNNEDLHMDRMKKLHRGFSLASINPVKVETIIEIFNSLKPKDAQLIADKTHFSVTSYDKASYYGSSGGDRRSLTRTYLFLRILHKACNQALSITEPHQQALYEELWKNEELYKLKAKVNSLAGELTQADAMSDISLDDPVVPPLPPRPAPVIEPEPIPTIPKSRAAHNWGRAKQQVQLAVMYRREDERQWVTDVAATLHRQKTELKDAFNEAQNNLRDNVGHYHSSQDLAYKNFVKMSEEVSKDLNFKVSIAQKLVKCVTALAPPPLNIIGVGISKAIGQFHADAVTQSSFNAQAEINENPSIIQSIQANVGTLQKTINDAALLGANPENFISFPALNTRMRTMTTELIEGIDKLWKDEYEARFGSYNPGPGIEDSTRAMARKVVENAGIQRYYSFKARQADKSVAATNEQERVLAISVNRNINAHYQSIKSVITSETTKPIGKSSDKLQKWITIYLISDYAADLTESYFVDKDIQGLGGVSFGNSFIKFLSDVNIGILKSQYSSSSEVYGTSALPFKSGHPAHVVGLAQYLRWVNNNLNPLQLATKKDFMDLWEDRSNAKLLTIGEHIAAHKVTRRLRHDILDDTFEIT